MEDEIELPDKCQHCGCTEIEPCEGFRNDQGLTEEVWYCCKKCRKILYIWSYGVWYKYDE